MYNYISVRAAKIYFDFGIELTRIVEVLLQKNNVILVVWKSEEVPVRVRVLANYSAFGPYFSTYREFICRTERGVRKSSNFHHGQGFHSQKIYIEPFPLIFYFHSQIKLLLNNNLPFLVLKYLIN